MSGFKVITIFPAFLNAAEKGNAWDVDRLLPNVIHDAVINKYRETALHLAAKNNYSAVVQTLLAQHGVDPNVKNKDGETPYGFYIHAES